MRFSRPPKRCVIGASSVCWPTTSSGPTTTSCRRWRPRPPGESAVCLRRLSTEMLSHYGVIVPGGEETDGVLDVIGAIEKPGPDRAPSNLGLIGRYVFTHEIFEILADLTPGHGGEIQLTDAIDQLAKRGRVQGLHRQR